MYGFLGLIFGTIAGFVAGQLWAPKPGKEMRTDLINATDDIYRRVAFEIEDIRTTPGGVVGLLEKLASVDEPHILIDPDLAVGE